MRALPVFLLLLLIVLAPTFAFAQDDACNWGELQTQLAGILSNLDNDPGITLVLLQATINDIRVRCASTMYTPDEFPDGIIGPIFLTAPIYEVTLTSTDHQAVARAYSIEDRCTISDLSAQPGTANTTLWRVSGRGCTVMIEVDGTDWELSITPLA